MPPLERPGPGAHPLTIIAWIRENNPSMEAYLQDREIGLIVSAYVMENWSPELLQARLLNTRYWKATPESGRQARLLQVTDPATWRQQVFNKEQAIAQEMGALGLPTNKDQLTWVATRALNEGWSDDYTRRQYATAFAPKDPLKWSGVLGDTYFKVRDRATEWGVPVGTEEAKLLALNVATFGGDPAHIEDHFRDKALKTYKGNAAILDAVANQGMTIREFASPYIDIAAQELGISAGQINISDPKWSRAFHTMSPEQGTFVPMGQDQWQWTIRTDQKYGYDGTANAREAATDMASQLLTTFGAKA